MVVGEFQCILNTTIITLRHKVSSFITISTLSLLYGIQTAARSLLKTALAHCQKSERQ
jgi:hypothetical protein